MDNNELILTHRETTQDVILEQLIKLVDDHEKRLRWLERYVNYAIGAFGLISLATNYIKH